MPEVRLAALDALGTLRADRSRARGLLADPDGLVRARAAGMLLEDAREGRDDGEGGVGPEEDAEAEAALARLTRSPHADTRAAAYRALAASRSPDALALARSGLSDTAPSVRAEAARTLIEVDPVHGVEEVIALVDRGGDVFEVAAEAMARSPERGAPVVRRLAESSAERALESRRLGDSIGDTEDVRLMLLRDSLLADSERHALRSIRAAALLGGRGAITTAIDSLTAPDPAQRANALEVIETLGDHELVRPLLALWEPGPLSTKHADWRERLLRDPDDWIRSCAGWATGPPAGGGTTGVSDATPATTDHTTDRGGSVTETLATLPLMERVLFLRRVPLFSDLPPQDLVPIATLASEQSYADADTIAEQGDPGDEMHIIVSGYVMVILREPSGHQQVLAVRATGDVIGEMAVITSGPRMASLAAKGPVRLLSIGRRPFEAMLRERPETALALMRVLCQRLTDRDAERTG